MWDGKDLPRYHSKSAICWINRIDVLHDKCSDLIQQPDECIEVQQSIQCKAKHVRMEEKRACAMHDVSRWLRTCRFMLKWTAAFELAETCGNPCLSLAGPKL